MTVAEGDAVRVGAEVTDAATLAAREDAQRWQDRYVELFDRCVFTRKKFQAAIEAVTDPLRKTALYDALQILLDPDGECDRSEEPL